MEDKKELDKKLAGRTLGLLGGPARAKKLTRERRIEIAKKAAEARWKKKQEDKSNG